jgi:hypothetical protein
VHIVHPISSVNYYSQICCLLSVSHLGLKTCLPQKWLGINHIGSCDVLHNFISLMGAAIRKFNAARLASIWGHWKGMQINSINQQIMCNESASRVRWQYARVDAEPPRQLWVITSSVKVMRHSTVWDLAYSEHTATAAEKSIYTLALLMTIDQ